MSQLLQKILITGGALGLIALGYFLFVQPSQFGLEGGAVDPLADSVLVKTQAFIGRRAQLDQVTIDASLFSDARFTSLRSYSSEVGTLPLGKNSLFELPPELDDTPSTNQ